MSQQPSGSLSPEQTQQLLSAGWWTSGHDRWFGPEQHPDPAHRAHFATPANLPQTMAYAEPQVAAQVDPALSAVQPAAPQAPPTLSPLAQQMAEEARRKAQPPMPELEAAGNGVPDEEWRRIVAANAAEMEANTPGRSKRWGSGKRAQRRSWLPVSALLFVAAGLVAFAYYVPSVRTTFIETKAQITGEQVPVTVRPAPNAVPLENGMAVTGDDAIAG